ncbi:hypothetical protein [Actinomadura craniellae]|nr:hypothetical protein [Actinomadura craniellae]
MSLELELLAELRGALVEHEIRAEIREDVMALAVLTDTPDVFFWVFVAFNMRYFSWNRGNHQHPVNDVAGAARRLADHITGLRLVGDGQ